MEGKKGNGFDGKLTIYVKKIIAKDISNSSGGPGGKKRNGGENKSEREKLVMYGI